MSDLYYKKASLLSFLSNQITLLKSGSSAREKISLNPVDSFTYVDIGLYDMDGQPISGDIVTVSGSNRIGGTGETIRVKGNVDVELIGKQITEKQEAKLIAKMENGSKEIVPIQTLELTNYKKDFEIMYNPMENNWKVTYSPK